MPARRVGEGDETAATDCAGAGEQAAGEPGWKGGRATGGGGGGGADAGFDAEGVDDGIGLELDSGVETGGFWKLCWLATAVVDIHDFRAPPRKMLAVELDLFRSKSSRPFRRLLLARSEAILAWLGMAEELGSGDCEMDV